jgi:hypothetical protein
MKEISIKQSSQAKLKLASYAPFIQGKLTYLRNLIIKTATEIADIQELEETLKWGELSYGVKKGSPIRIDWKAKNPTQYAIYFNCNTSLVETFKMEYGDLFEYEKNRAILFNLDEEIPENELKQCIEMALKYHTLKKKK